MAGQKDYDHAVYEILPATVVERVESNSDLRVRRGGAGSAYPTDVHAVIKDAGVFSILRQEPAPGTQVRKTSLTMGRAVVLDDVSLFTDENTGIAYPLVTAKGTGMTRHTLGLHNIGDNLSESELRSALQRVRENTPLGFFGTSSMDRDVTDAKAASGGRVSRWMAQIFLRPDVLSQFLSQRAEDIQSPYPLEQRLQILVNKNGDTPTLYVRLVMPNYQDMKLGIREGRTEGMNAPHHLLNQVVTTLAEGELVSNGGEERFRKKWKIERIQENITQVLKNIQQNMYIEKDLIVLELLEAYLVGFDMGNTFVVSQEEFDGRIDLIDRLGHVQNQSMGGISHDYEQDAAKSPSPLVTDYDFIRLGIRNAVQTTWFPLYTAVQGATTQNIDGRRIKDLADMAQEGFMNGIAATQAYYASRKDVDKLQGKE